MLKLINKFIKICLGHKNLIKENQNVKQEKILWLILNPLEKSLFYPPTFLFLTLLVPLVFKILILVQKIILWFLTFQSLR